MKTGFERRLNLVGVGYRAQAQGNKVNLTLTTYDAGQKISSFDMLLAERIEAVANAIKHAGAGAEIEVTVRGRAGEIAL